MIENIGKYKPEQLQFRDPNIGEIVEVKPIIDGVFVNDECFYIVIYQKNSKVYKTAVGINGTFCSKLILHDKDVIIKKTEEFDIGQYKPEQLQTRGGLPVVGVYLDGTEESRKENPHTLTYYSVIVKERSGQHRLQRVGKAGNYTHSVTVASDIILKPTFNLEDYLTKPELLQTRSGSEVLALVRDKNTYVALVKYRDGQYNHKTYPLDYKHLEVPFCVADLILKEN